MIDKILGLATAGSSLASAGLVTRSLTQARNNLIGWLVCVLALFVAYVSAMFVLYFILVIIGMNATQAGLAISAASCFLACAVGAVAAYHLWNVKRLLRLETDNHTLLTDTKNILLAFVNGFSSPKK